MIMYSVISEKYYKQIIQCGIGSDQKIPAKSFLYNSEHEADLFTKKIIPENNLVLIKLDLSGLEDSILIDGWGNPVSCQELDFPLTLDRISFIRYL